MPDPTSSGAAFLQLAAVKQRLGAEAGRELWRGVARNLAGLESSAFGPCAALLAGRCTVAATVSTAASRLQRDYPHVVAVIPADGAGFEPEAFALMRHARRPMLARQVLDWMTSETALAICRAYGKIVPSATGVTSPFPDAGPEPFAVDIEQAAAERESILAWWRSAWPPA